MRGGLVIVFFRRLHAPVFLAMEKVGVRQYKDSDSKPGVGVSTQVRVPVNGHQRGSQL